MNRVISKIIAFFNGIKHCLPFKQKPNHEEVRQTQIDFIHVNPLYYDNLVYSYNFNENKNIEYNARTESNHFSTNRVHMENAHLSTSTAIGGAGMSFANINHIKGQLEKGIGVIVVDCKSSTDDYKNISEEIFKTIKDNCATTVIFKAADGYISVVSAEYKEAFINRIIEKTGDENIAKMEYDAHVENVGEDEDGLPILEADECMSCWQQ